MQHYTISPDTHIGHTNLRVADLYRLSFYRDVPGCAGAGLPSRRQNGCSGSQRQEPRSRVDGSSRRLSTTPNSTGLDHLAIRYPSKRELAYAYQHLCDCGIRFQEATDYGTNQSLYGSDPDGKEIELYWQAPLREGQLPFQNRP